MAGKFCLMRKRFFSFFYSNVFSIKISYLFFILVTSATASKNSSHEVQLVMQHASQNMRKKDSIRIPPMTDYQQMVFEAKNDKQSISSTSPSLSSNSLESEVTKESKPKS